MSNVGTLTGHIAAKGNAYGQHWAHPAPPLAVAVLFLRRAASSPRVACTVFLGGVFQFLSPVVEVEWAIAQVQVGGVLCLAAFALDVDGASLVCPVGGFQCDWPLCQSSASIAEQNPVPLQI